MRIMGLKITIVVFVRAEKVRGRRGWEGVVADSEVIPSLENKDSLR